MYDIHNKKGLGAITNLVESILFFNESYVPFSLLFNLNYDYSRTWKEMQKKVKEDYSKLDKVDLLNSKLRSWIEEIPSIIALYQYSTRDLVSKFYSIITDELYFRKTRFRNHTNFIKGYYTLFDEELYTCYFILIVKKEYVKYVKLCYITNEPILEDCFELWYDGDRIHEAGDKVVRLTNKVIKELTSRDIPCLDKRDIMGLLLPEIKFTAPTISKQKEIINEFVENFTKFELNGS